MQLSRNSNASEKRWRRNSLLFWNVRKGNKKDVTMVEFINIEIMKAHRTPLAIRRDASKPRPIHVYLLRYSKRSEMLERQSI